MRKKSLPKLKNKCIFWHFPYTFLFYQSQIQVTFFRKCLFKFQFNQLENLLIYSFVSLYEKFIFLKKEIRSGFEAYWNCKETLILDVSEYCIITRAEEERSNKLLLQMLFHCNFLFHLNTILRFPLIFHYLIWIFRVFLFVKCLIDWSLINFLKMTNYGKKWRRKNVYCCLSKCVSERVGLIACDKITFLKDAKRFFKLETVNLKSPQV